uniref:EOG090X05ZS n=1 Tax=Lynceus sp. MCZ IZ 141354 TaxID=1930659 RepID=A0A9N6ZFJ1_9CRUS|nr:EOG090X05ZS [Lynceus sp. MCZ IZ 141354]
MHFSIPDTAEVNDEKGTSFTVYKIHINGVHHCTLRYKQLRHLHDQLVKLYNSDSLPCFPGKRFFSLSSSQAEERRLLLERYVQLVAQDVRISNSAVLTTFLRQAQQETHLNCTSNEVMLCIILPSSDTTVVEVGPTEQTESVMKKLCFKLGVGEDHTGYFGLYIEKLTERGWMLIRKLQSYESPYVSQLATNCCRITLRKSYWDPSYDNELMKNCVSLDLIYQQFVCEMENFNLNAQMKSDVNRLIKMEKKEELLKYARKIKFFGGICFSNCISNYPKPETDVTIHAVNKELIFVFEDKEMTFKVTRIRSWRITSVSSENWKEARLELSFEYLLSKDKMQWITIMSDQAVMISLSLQGIVDELMRKQSGSSGSSCSGGDRVTDDIGITATYMTQDGSIIPLISPSSKCRSISKKSIASKENLAVRFRISALGNSQAFVENHAFNEIQDDDL